MASAFRRYSLQKEEDSPRKSLEKEGQLVACMGRANVLLPLPNGEHIIISDSEKGLCLFSIRTGERLITYTGHKGTVTIMSLLGNNAFASVSNNTILVHSISNGTELSRFKYRNALQATSWLGNGRFIVFTEEGKILDMHWNETSGLTYTKTVVVLSDTQQFSRDDKISLHGNRCAISSWACNTVTVFDVTSFNSVGTVEVLDPRQICLRDQILVIGCDSGKVIIYNALTLDLICKMDIHSKRVSSVRVLAKGRYLLSSGWDGLVCIHDINSNAQIWQKKFNNKVHRTRLLSDGHLVTRFFDEATVVHSIPQYLVQSMIPAPTPLRDAFNKCISDAKLPVECIELITFERCCVSFDEWCCAHQLLMMAVEDNDIQGSGDHKGEIGWWFDHLYVAAKDIQLGSQDELRAIKRFLVQAKNTGVVEGIEAVLAAMRVTQDVKKEVRLLQRTDILMLERVLTIEGRLNNLKEAYERYRRYARNSQLLGVALQIIPIVGGSVANIVSIGAQFLEGLPTKDLTDYFLGFGGSLSSDEESSMGERVFSRTAEMLGPKILDKMNMDHRQKLEKVVSSYGLSVDDLRELFDARAIHSKDVRSKSSAIGSSAADPKTVQGVVEEGSSDLKP